MNRRVLLGVGVAALVAIGIWFWKGRGGGGDKPADPPAAAAKGTDATPRPPLGAGAGSAGPASGGGDPGQAILIDDDPTGDERLEGQVIDADEDPVGGATVVLSSNPPRTTTTEADGSFVFDGLVGRPYQVAARAPGGVAGPVTVRLTGKTPPVILKLGPASTVVIEVVDERGGPIDGASVELRGLDDQRATAAAGKATLAPVVPGGYQLAAWAKGYAKSFQWLQVAGETTTARIALRGGAPVSGRVVAEDGRPIAGARVLYSGASDWSQQPDERLDAAVTGDDGAFRFDAVAAGSVRFQARHPEYAPAWSAIVTLDGELARDGVEITMQAGAAVTGRVVDGDGAPVASARVRIGVVGSGFASGPPRQVFSGEDGGFAVRGLPRRALEAVAIAEAASSETIPVDTTGGDVAGVELVVDVTGTIAGKVVDPQGEPIEGVQVSAFPDFRSRSGGGDFASFRLRGFPEDLTDADGSFTLTGLAPGDYQIRASRQQRRGGRGFLGETTPAKTGDTGVKIVLPVDGGVKGKVAFEDGSAPSTFSVSVAFATEPFATPDGTFALSDLPPGDYDLKLQGTGFEPKTTRVTVKAAEVTDAGAIVVRKGRTIRGTVLADGQPVEGASVYVGAQIFGNGSSNKADFGGPPGGGSSKEATTDAQGQFSLTGFGKRDLTIIAEHVAHGRSKAIRLIAGDPNEQDLKIPLQGFGSMSGTLTEDGKVAEGIAISVQSTTAPGAMYGVASGPDGTWRLDRLAPDRYKVSGMAGMNPMRGMGFFSKTVAVESGQETKVDLAIQRGTITLSAQPTVAGGGQANGFGWVATGTVTAATGRELSLRLAEHGDGMSKLSIFMLGQPLEFRELVAGKYTVCVLPLPSGLEGMSAMSYAQEHADDLPCFCKPVVVAASPDQQSTTIEVEIPPMITEE